MNSFVHGLLHALAGVYGVAVTLSGITLPAALLAAIPHAQLAVGLATLLVTVVSTAQNLIKADKAASIAKVAMLFVVGLFAVSSIQGCQALQNPAVDAGIQAAIDIGVGTWLQKDPAVAPLVVTEALALEQLASKNTSSVVDLEAQANKLIAASSLPIADKAAFQTLLALVAGPNGLLVEGVNALPANASVPLSLIFADIANAAGLYGKAQAHSAGLVLVKPVR